MLELKHEIGMSIRIENLKAKLMVGKRTKMSFAENKIKELWSGFMPRRNEIKNSLGTDLFSMEVYNPLFFHQFSPAAEFEKWAAIEVSDFNSVPEGMETIIVPGGMYAVFIHHGPASEGAKTYQYIFEKWLPEAEYILDNRPHFAVMGEKYKPNDAHSEEEIWIPVKKKQNDPMNLN